MIPIPECKWRLYCRFLWGHIRCSMCNVVVPVHYAIVRCFVHPALDLTEYYSLQEKNAVSSIDCLVQSCPTYKILCEDINFIEASSCFNAEVVQRPCLLWMIVVYPLAQPTIQGPTCFTVEYRAGSSVEQSMTEFWLRWIMLNLQQAVRTSLVACGRYTQKHLKGSS